MRIIGEIPHSDCKITLFHWNNRYLIKMEIGYFEQTFKLDQFDLSNEQDLTSIVNEKFINEAIERFNGMQLSLHEAKKSL